MGIKNEQAAAAKPSYLSPEHVIRGVDLPISAKYVNSQLVLSLYGMRLALPPHIAEQLTGQIINILEFRQPPSQEDLAHFHRVSAEHAAFDGPDTADEDEQGHYAPLPYPRASVSEAQTETETEAQAPPHQEEFVATAPAVGGQALEGAGTEVVFPPQVAAVS